MAFSRRRIFKMGGAILVAAATPSAMSAARRDLPAADATLYTAGTFQPMVNSGFKVESDGVQAYLTLLSVTPCQPAQEKPLRGAASGPRTDAAILNFSASGDALAQGTYELSHANLGRFQLFLVPAGTFRYAATLNQLIDADPAFPPPVRRTRKKPEQE